MRNGSRRSVIKFVSIGFSLMALGLLIAVLVMFVHQSAPIWRKEGMDFLTGKRWFYRQEEFGVAPMIYGSLAVAAIAMVLATPMGIGAALFSSEFLPARVRLIYKVAIELLAGVPSVVYGLLGILVLRDWVYRTFESYDLLSGDTLLTGGILLSIMILPTVVTLSDDALTEVPRSQRLAARGLGLTAGECAMSISLRQSVPGLFAAVLLAVGRACGEMIAVFLVVGRQDNQWPSSLVSLRPLLESGQTLATKLGSSETNIAYGDPVHWSAMVAVGLLLLLITSGFTLVGLKIRKMARA